MYPTIPRVIQLETIAKCSGRCPHCPQRQAKRHTDLLPMATIAKVVTEMLGHGVIYRPFLVGEPLADERLVTIVGYIKGMDATAKVEIHSNGALMTPELAYRLIGVGLDVARFSVDGLHAETMAKARPGLSITDV